MSNYMSNAQLKALDVERLEAFRTATDGRRRPRLKPEERMVWYDATPKSLERCRTLALGLSAQDVRAPIAERLHCCLYALSSQAPAEWGFGPAAIRDQVQATLSALLVAHPVLMHPVLKCAATSKVLDGNYTMPVAITLPGYARLPMRHDGFSDEQLAAWLTHPGPNAGLRSRTPMDNGLTVLIRSRLPITHAVTETPQGRPDLLASLHDLFESTVGEVSPKLLPYHIGLPDNAAPVMARSLVRAAHLGTVASRRYIELVRTTYRDSVPNLCKVVADVAAAGLGEGSGLTSKPAEHVRACVGMLIDSGISSDAHEAARHLLKGCRYPEGWGYDLERVVELLRELRKYGVTPTDDELMMNPSTKLPLAEWVTARQMVEADVAMKAVLARATESANEASAARGHMAPRRARVV